MNRTFTALASAIALQFAGFFATAQWQALPSPTGLVINDITYHDSRFFLSTKTGVYTLHPDEDEVKYYDMGLEGVENVNFFYAKNDAELFVGTQVGLYRSLDGGGNWVYVVNDIKSQRIYSIVEEGGKLVISTGSGVYISSNGGTNWEILDWPLYYVGSISKYKGQFFIENDTLLYKAPTLETLSTGQYEKQVVTGEELSIASSGDTIAFLSDTQGIYLSYNAGDDWQNIKWTHLELEPTSMFLNDESLWITTRDSIYKANYGEFDWTAVFGMKDQSLNNIFITDSQIIVGATNSIIMSSNKGEEWALIKKGLPEKRLDQKRVYKEKLYAHSTDREIYELNDDKSWSLYCPAYNNDFTVISWEFVGDLWFGVSNSKTFLSSDFGKSWSEIHSGRLEDIVALNESTLIAYSSNKGVVKSTSNGMDWLSSNLGIEQRFAWNGHYLFKRDQYIYLLAYSTTGVIQQVTFESNNEGATWESHEGVFDSLGLVKQFFDHGGTEYVISSDGAKKMYKSTSDGSFELIPSIRNSTWDDRIYHAIGDSESSTLYALTATGMYLYHPDRGWRGVSKGLPVFERFSTGSYGNEFRELRFNGGSGEVEFYRDSIALLVADRVYVRAKSEFDSFPETPEISRYIVTRHEATGHLQVDLAWDALDQGEISQYYVSIGQSYINNGKLLFFNNINAVEAGITSYSFVVGYVSDRTYPIRIFSSNNGDFSFLSREVTFPAKPDLYWEVSDKAEILGFELEEAMAPAEIDSINQKIRVVIVDSTDITNLSPFIQISDYATISPEPETPQDFTSPFTYTVTASMGNVKEWVVEVERYVQSANNDILDFSLPQQTELAIIDTESHTVSVEVKPRTNISRLTPTIVVPDSAFISPPSGTRQDFTSAMVYSVTAENGAVQDWTVHVYTGPLSAEDLSGGQLKVYPNPGKQYLSIESYSRPMEGIQIIDVTGKVYEVGYEKAGNSFIVNIELLSPGSYFLKMKSAGKVFYTRIIKE